MPKYFDIHSHLNSKEFDIDLDDAIQRLRNTETHTIVIGTDYESSKKAVEIAEKYDEVYASIGIHPVDDLTRVFEKEKFEELLKHPKVVAIGECGIDLFRIDKEKDFERQKKLFLEHIELALEYDKPIMIHSRDAYVEVLEILEPMVKLHGSKLRGNSHFFTGTLEEAKRFWAIGFSTSFTGVITFARDYDEVIKNAPIEMLMSETDSPYVAPVPYRGKAMNRAM
jgi:Mg-dependent DNase